MTYVTMRSRIIDSTKINIIIRKILNFVRLEANKLSRLMLRTMIKVGIVIDVRNANRDKFAG